MSVLYWNDVALEANRVAHTNELDKGTLGPTLSSRAMAIVHLAMYDAYAKARGNPGKMQPYRMLAATPKGGAAPAAATAGAAYTALAALYPSQKAFFEKKLLEAGLAGPGVDDGFEFGVAAAKELLAYRQSDPGSGDEGYSHQATRPHHRPDPDNPAQGFHAPYYGAKSRCYAVTARHGLLDPRTLAPAEYNAAVREVRAKGIAPSLMGTLPAGSNPRTTLETLIGIYWGYDGASGLGTPPRLYNQIVRVVAQAQPFTPSTDYPIHEDQLMRLFALVNAAMGDAGVLAWEQKYIHDFWRPVIGVRDHDPSMGLSSNPGSVTDPDCDPEWLPLGAPKTNATGKKNFTPPFPAYPSGHATFGAAALGITRLFYGHIADGPDPLFNGLAFVSDEYNGVNADNNGTVRPRHLRAFPGGLWEMIVENGVSRVYLGVHWVFDSFAVDSMGAMDLTRNYGGVPLGLTIAKDIFDNGNGLRASAV
ncbi:MAG: vanadium-dependent haloperoxidase [Acidobacteria bacterium]|nr:vanadium-dependent haloperoxidase [Acidobacteriota bacterium]